MQKLTTKELQGFQNEFEMTCAAQDGDGRAWLALWNHYQAMMMSRLIAAKGLAREELESEACEVFAYKLSLFDRTKVKSETAFSMFSWLFCAAVNKTNKLIRQRKKDVHLYFEKVNAASGDQNETLAKIYLYEEEEPEDSLQNQMRGINDDVYSTYSPEKMVVESLHEDDTERVKAFYVKLTQFEKDILEARREGLTLAQVAKKFCCSVTTVKNHVQRAKRYADDIFQVCYA
jgi:RNA polymerase sigma factor (sigma-70 family)